LPFRLVHVNTEMDIRENRVLAELGDGRTIRQLENHSTEIEVVTKLPQIADVVVNGSNSIEEPLAVILSKIDLWSR